MEVRTNLDRLGRDNDVTLKWITGHKNLRADVLGKSRHLMLNNGRSLRAKKLLTEKETKTRAVGRPIHQVDSNLSTFLAATTSKGIHKLNKNYMRIQLQAIVN